MKDNVTFWQPVSRNLSVFQIRWPGFVSGDGEIYHRLGHVSCNKQKHYICRHWWSRLRING